MTSHLVDRAIWFILFHALRHARDLTDNTLNILIETVRDVNAYLTGMETLFFVVNLWDILYGGSFGLSRLTTSSITCWQKYLKILSSSTPLLRQRSSSLTHPINLRSVPIVSLPSSQISALQQAVSQNKYTARTFPRCLSPFQVYRDIRMLGLPSETLTCPSQNSNFSQH